MTFESGKLFLLYLKVIESIRFNIDEYIDNFLNTIEKN